METLIVAVQKLVMKDVILSVGYRVNSKESTYFRKWANSVLKNYLLKGYAINKNIIDTHAQEYQNLIELLSKTLVNFT